MRNRRDKSKRSLPPYQYVDEPAQWKQCLAALQRETRLAVDLEANSMYAYREQVCLIQISTAKQDYIVDPIADLDLSGLGAIIADPAVEKVFHAAEYDVMLMERQYGWKLNNLFDTMWAARVLGYDRVGLANILADLYHVKLNKRYQRANWCRRPLTPPQLSYAQADTHYLLRLRDHFARRLEAAGRVEEAKELFAEQTRVQLPDLSFDPDAFWKLNGSRRLSPGGKAVLRELLIYRDREARKLDRPHFKVIQDKALLKVAQDLPANAEELGTIHGISERIVRRFGDDLLRIVAEKRNAPAPKRPPRSPRPPEAVQNRYDRLHDWRKQRGLARGVESDVILSRNSMWELARANPGTVEELAQIEGIGPWRQKTYGEEILDVLNGED